MKNVIYALAAVSGLAIAAPAAAQYPYPSQSYPSQSYPSRNDPYQRSYPYNANTQVDFEARFDERLDQFQERLDAGIRAGQIDRTEARNLRVQIRSLTRLEQQYAYDGITQQERMDLMQRMRTLRQDFRVADGGAYDRNSRYGANDDFYNERYSGQGGPYDADGDGWDDRDCDRDGDIDARDCVAPRSGLGGLIDSVLGTSGLQVGQRVSGNLYAVPSQYRDRYRDDSRYYYRSDGRRIYQVDGRTDTIVRVYPM